MIKKRWNHVIMFKLLGSHSYRMLSKLLLIWPLTWSLIWSLIWSFYQLLFRPLKVYCFKQKFHLHRDQNNYQSYQRRRVICQWNFNWLVCLGWRNQSIAKSLTIGLFPKVIMQHNEAVFIFVRRYKIIHILQEVLCWFSLLF